MRKFSKGYVLTAVLFALQAQAGSAASELHTSMRRYINYAQQFDIGQSAATGQLSDSTGNSRFALSTSASADSLHFVAQTLYAAGTRVEEADASGGSSEKLYILPQVSVLSGYLRFAIRATGSATVSKYGSTANSRARGQVFTRLSLINGAGSADTVLGQSLDFALFDDGYTINNSQPIAQGLVLPTDPMMPGVMVGEFAFSTAAPIYLTMGGYCEAEAYAFGVADATAAMCELSQQWLGITGIYDNAHNPLPGLTRTLSESGFDYGSFQGPALAAVPEPGQWALVIGGFCTIGGAVRGRRRATPAGRCSCTFA